MAASVPELTMRTISARGHAVDHLARPARTSASVVAPKLVPRAAAAVTASITAGWAWPAISGPHEHIQSR